MAGALILLAELTRAGGPRTLFSGLRSSRAQHCAQGGCLLQKEAGEEPSLPEGQRGGGACLLHALLNGYSLFLFISSSCSSVNRCKATLSYSKMKHGLTSPGTPQFQDGSPLAAGAPGHPAQAWRAGGAAELGPECPRARAQGECI